MAVLYILGYAGFISSAISVRKRTLLWRKLRPLPVLADSRGCVVRFAAEPRGSVPGNPTEPYSAHPTPPPKKRRTMPKQSPKKSFMNHNILAVGILRRAWFSGLQIIVRAPGGSERHTQCIALWL